MTQVKNIHENLIMRKKRKLYIKVDENSLLNYFTPMKFLLFYAILESESVIYQIQEVRTSLVIILELENY